MMTGVQQGRVGCNASASLLQNGHEIWYRQEKLGTYNGTSLGLQTESVDLNMISAPVHETCAVIVAVPCRLDGGHGICHCTLLSCVHIRTWNLNNNM